MTVLSPFVYWAQSEDNIFLKVDLKDAKDTIIDLQSRALNFHAKGFGAQGLNNYSFSIDFHSGLTEKDKTIKITDHKIDLTLPKAEKGWWPRLTSQPQKPAWLKVDFDKWQSEDDILDEEVRDIREDYPGLYENLQKQEMGYIKEEFKKVYLTFYNLCMFVGFMYISLVLCIKYAKDGPNFFPHTYEAVGSAVKFMQLMQCLEIMHPIFGYVKGGVLMPSLQVIGRLFILLIMVDQEPRIQRMPVTFFLFLVWSSIEVIRYPYYMSQLYKKENGLLTWLRYTAWIVLYPVGFTCEGMIVFRNTIFVDQSNKWTVSMPNPLNFTFHFPTFLRIYMMFLMAPAMYSLMSHMYKMRKQKLGKPFSFSKFKKSL